MDPRTPKTVPPDHWYAAPATPEGTAPAGKIPMSVADGLEVI